MRQCIQFTQALHFTIDVLNILSDISCTFQKDELPITDIAVKFEARLIKLKVLKQLNGKSLSEYTTSAETQPSDTQKAALFGFVDQVITFLQKIIETIHHPMTKTFQPMETTKSPHYANILLTYSAMIAWRRL